MEQESPIKPIQKQFIEHVDESREKLTEANKLFRELVLTCIVAKPDIVKDREPYDTTGVEKGDLAFIDRFRGFFESSPFYRDIRDKIDRVSVGYFVDNFNIDNDLKKIFNKIIRLRAGRNYEQLPDLSYELLKSMDLSLDRMIEEKSRKF